MIEIIYIGILGLCVGSFLNVVIVRVPKEMSLWMPGSHCHHCKHPLRWRDNIPLLSYFVLKGQCHDCQRPISLRYPIVEIITCLLSMSVSLRLGFSLETLFGLLFTWALITLTFIDLEHLLLPNSITLPMLFLGLFLNLFHIFTSSNSAIWGAILGYFILWLVYWMYKIVTRKEGMGCGDFKLLAMLGAWFGWQMLPFLLLFSSITATLFGATLMFLKKFDKNTPIPFGPFLALGGWFTLLFGEIIQYWYFGNGT